MVTIRGYQPTEVVQATQAVPVRPVQSGAGQVASGLQDVANALDTWADEIDTADAKSADAAFSDGMREILYGDTSGYMYATGGDAVSRREAAAKAMDQLYTETLGKLSPGARRKAESALTARKSSGLSTIDQHAAGQRRGYLNSASEARVEAFKSDAQLDVLKFDSAWRGIESEILDMADREGWAPEVTALKLKEAKSEMHGGIVTRLASVDPEQAIAYLGDHRDEMLGESVTRLEAALVPMAKERKGKRLGQQAAFGGVSDTYLSSIRAAESGGNDTAKNPLSTATGRYQFIEETWNGLMRKFPELGLTADGRTDAAQQELAIRAFTAENAKGLMAAGIEPTNGNLYAAHFLGLGGALSVLKEDPASLVSDHVSGDVIAANGFLSGMTVADFAAWAARKGGGSDIGYSESAGGLASLLGIEDPDVREAAIREFELRGSVAAAEAEQRRAALQDAAFQAIEGGGSVDDLPLDVRSGLGMDALSSLRAYEGKVKSGRAVTTDEAFWVSLMDQAAREPQVFASQDPMTWRDKLSDNDFQAMVKMRADVIEKGTKPAGLPDVSSIRTASKTALEAAGIDDPAKLAQFETSILRWSQAFVAEKGVAPTPLELNEKINHALVPVVINPPGLGNEISGPSYSLTFGGDPLTEGDEITPQIMRQSTLTINDKTVPVTDMEEFAKGFEETYGYAPTPQELVEGLIATGLY